ncbi:hypothetical protein BDV93DRAFT_117624 [Ceratobasidium sp. AG-I]|nr:hypothetical protein BDV93DRAFT_117624 [Ceratobasidium sp. AG-I]
MSNASFSSVPSVSDDGPEEVATEAVGLAASSYGVKQRKLLDLINRLHNTGIQSDIDLPQICVVGSQSAGKSSLIESISGIKLPRATGTCTRCPTECRLAFSNDPWKCTVHLRFLKDEKGNDISPIRNVQFGGVITNKVDVEDRLRRAQLAILNPGVDSDKYLTGNAPAGSSGEVAFSENFVSVEISGPEVTNLSFCDLPGIIANVREGSDEGDIELVKRLVSSYIQKDSCIILLTVTCETDFENQGARALAKQYDPAGKRTIGVLTKPDRIERGEEQKWLKFIRGESEALLKGWFCVKQPSPAELEQNLTWAEARRREEEFFNTQTPWSSQTMTVRHYFGTARLTSRLSEILSSLIATRLPDILSEIQRLTLDTTGELRALPEEISDDPAGTVLSIVMEFQRDVETHVEGVPEGDGLIQKLHVVYEKFRKEIRSSAPEFRPFKQPTGDEETAFIMPEIAFLTEEEAAVSGSNPDRILHENDISKMSKEAVTRELPKNVPFIVKRKLIKRFVELWEGPTMTLLEDIELILSDYMRKLVDNFFKQHSYGGLHNAVGGIVADRIIGCREYAEAQTRFLLSIENNQTFTTNTHYLADYKEKFMAYYKTVRKSHEGESTFVEGLMQGISPDTDFGQSLGEVLANLTKMGLSIQPHQLSKLLESDAEEDVVDIMAEVRAYYQVAYKRFVDIVPMAIDETLVRGFSRGLQTRLFEGLGVSGENAKEHCAGFLAHPHEITLQREMLKTRRDRLALAKREISAIWGN